MDVVKWLGDLGLGQYADTFVDNDIDLDVVPELTDADLKDLGVSLGHRKRLLRAIGAVLAAGQSSTDTEIPARRGIQSAPQAIAGEGGERRYLTVLFVDMVGSTGLSSELDPEDYQAILRSYQESCAGALVRYDGFIARYMGDGILAYFGYPRAHEDDAERAVRAGKEVIEVVSSLAPRPGLRLRSRVGIATGEVVVGDTVGKGMSEETIVSGETPNLAARLQGLARPDTVVISGRTRRLIEEGFILNDLGLHDVKGFSQPQEAFEVVGERDAESRERTRWSRQGVSELVGREEEAGLFLRRWDMVKEGEGQVVLLSAEAGVGKSRLIKAVQDRLRDESCNRILYFGSPFRQSSALYPVADQLWRVLSPGRHGDEAFVLDRIESVLEDLGMPAGDCAPYLSSILGIDSARRYGLPESTPDEFRKRTMASVIDIILRMSEQRPVLMVVDDTHWIDPTTLELLDALVNRIRDKRVLLVIAFRPEFEAPWGRVGHVTTCTLNHLTRRECAALATHVAGGKALPEDLVAQIVSHTDGVPLFVEELTKSILESGDLHITAGGYELHGALSSLAIPDTLQESLMARLDRLSSAKEIAQIGAVIGRQFDYGLVSRLVDADEARLDDALENLVSSGLVFRYGEKPDAIFEFKHALVRDVSYESLLKTKRRRIHERIARVLENEPPSRGAAEPELLAYHFEYAGKLEAAVRYWLMAAQTAADRSAYRESIDHCQRGLGLLEGISDEDFSSRWELEFQMVLGASSMAIHGFSSPKVIEAYTRAHELAKQRDEPTRLFTASWGMWIHQQQTGQIDSARNTVDELLSLSEQLGDTEFRLEAHHAAWTTYFRMGDFKRCLLHAEQGIALHDPEEHFALATRYAGHDAAICARTNAALSAWYLGYPDQAVAHEKACATLIDLITHPLSKIHGKCFGSILYRHLGDAESALSLVEDSLELNRQLGHPQYTGYSEVIQGWAIARVRDKRKGIATMEQAIDNLNGMGAWARCGTFLPCLVDIYAENNDAEKALGVVEKALDLIEKSGERTAETEILVLKGEILQSAGAALADVEAALEAALDTARSHAVRAMELRAATALAKLWMENGRRKDARELLRPVYGAFTEGFETPDLKAAERVLEDIESRP